MDESTRKTHKFRILFEEMKMNPMGILEHLLFFIRRVIISLVLIFGWNHGAIQAGVISFV